MSTDTILQVVPQIIFYIVLATILYLVIKQKKS